MSTTRSRLLLLPLVLLACADRPLGDTPTVDDSANAAVDPVYCDQLDEIIIPE